MIEIKDTSNDLSNEEIEELNKTVTLVMLENKLLQYYETDSFNELKKRFDWKVSEKHGKKLKFLRELFKKYNLYNKIYSNEEKIELKLSLTQKRNKTKREIKFKEEELLKFSDYDNASSQRVKKLILEIRGVLLKQKEEPILTVEEKGLASTALKLKRKHSALINDDLLKLFSKYISRLKNDWKSRLSNMKSSANQIELAQRKKVEEYQRLEEEKLIERIKNRKLSKDVSDKVKEAAEVITKEETLVIAMHNEFNSKASRESIYGSTIDMIKFAILEGVIRFNIEDEKFFDTTFIINNNVLSFSVVKNEENETALIDLNTIDKTIENILNLQDINSHTKNIVIDCLSVLHYLAVYSIDENRVQDNKKLIPDANRIKNKTQVSNNVESRNIIRINTSASTSIKSNRKNLIGNDKSWLTRGHWRRQKYTECIKLIWIEPFWKGTGKEIKNKTYVVFLENRT